MDPMDAKSELLDTVYRVFDEYAARTFTVACGPGCPVCCTRDVTATTLEARKMLKTLNALGRTDLLARLPEVVQGDLFRPKLTTNTLAMACLTQQEPPLEEPGRDQGPCLFLENNRCVAYEARPLTCRGMFSMKTCRPGEEADAPELLVTIVSLCWQIIEHLDVGGLYGNLLDLMRFLGDSGPSQAYEAGQRVMKKGVPPTRPVPGFLIPPDQEDQVRLFLDALFDAPTPSGRFRERMAEMRKSPF